MARGWESKAVEAQQEEARRSGESPVRPRSPADLQRLAARRTLELARIRARSDLARATNPAHQSMLEAQLAAIDTRLAALNPRR